MRKQQHKALACIRNIRLTFLILWLVICFASAECVLCEDIFDILPQVSLVWYAVMENVRGVRHRALRKEVVNIVYAAHQLEELK